ncbi:hypothetical protein GCM10017783_12240 [Deinococcus piscis]|uniref:Uncharacterized protein n=1 Tax=Deinococcus piscis TaxID=394230 RepID=A0ABQ3K2W5_9DEIO|nr:tetratricopeptide repeat protein [Deinococcus piscis]GHG01564.1 hypothetical protein GCM10017783_12240 [Deinococcus piscis]
MSGTEGERDAGVSAAEWEASVQGLLEVGRAEEALRTLTRAARQVQGSARITALLDLLGQFPDQVRQQPEAQSVRLRLLGNLPGGAGKVRCEVQAALDQGLDWPCLHAYLAWSLSQHEEDGAALAASEAALARQGELTEFEQLLVWRSRGQSLARLDRPGWAEAFAQALTRCTGRARGITLMEWGAVLSRTGDQAGAMTAFAQAHELLRHDPLCPWPLNSMGLICLHAARLDEAERYFADMARAQKGSAVFLSRALSGQAAVRRVRGEWAAARHLYSQAEEAALRASDEDDLRQARRGRGHTWRLSGHPLTALDDLTRAAQSVEQEREQEESWVYADIAAALVALPSLDSARVLDALSRTGPLGREDRDRVTLVRAELARRQGDEGEALALLGTLDRSLLWVREEAHAFPDLFGLLALDQRPAPLRDTGRLQVSVRALGRPEVRVGARRTEVPPQALLVLVALLEGRGECSSDLLTEVLDDQRPRSLRQAKQRASKAVAALRTALGWPDSVLSAQRGYRLSPDVDWHYDVAQAQAAGESLADAEFLSGLDFAWVTDREQELRQKDADFLA